MRKINRKKESGEKSVKMRKEQIVGSGNYKVLKKPYLEWIRYVGIADVTVIFSLYFLGITLYMKYITYTLAFSLGTGLFGAIFMALFIYIENRKVEYYQKILNDSLKYITDVVFFLSTGENVASALNLASNSAEGEVKDNIKESIARLEKDGVLDTSPFNKYHFATLNQFHHNLHLYYENGGDVKEIFETPKEFMLSELIARDQLLKKRKLFNMGANQLVGLVLLILLTIRATAEDVYKVYLNSPYALDIILGIELLVLGFMYLVHRIRRDITVRF